MSTLKNLTKVPDYISKNIVQFDLYIPADEPEKENVYVFDSAPQYGGFDEPPRVWITGRYYVRIFFSAGYEQTGVVALQPTKSSMSASEHRLRQEKLALLILGTVEAFRDGATLDDLFGDRREVKAFDDFLNPFYRVQGYGQLG